MASSVDFPHPEGPLMDTNSPRSISRCMPASACVSTSSLMKTLLRFSRWMSDIASLRFPYENVSVKRLELELWPAAIDRAVHAMIHAHAIFAAVGPAVFDHWLAPRGVQLHVEIAVNFAIVGLQLHARLGVGRQRHINIAIERAERHALVRRDLIQLDDDALVERMRDHRSRNIRQLDAPVGIVHFDFARDVATNITPAVIAAS